MRLLLLLVQAAGLGASNGTIDAPMAAPRSPPTFAG
jgi:hypothetical protein